MKQFSLLLLVSSLTVNAQTWIPAYVDLKETCLKLEEANPFDEMKDDYDPHELIFSMNERVDSLLQVLAPLNLPIDSLKAISVFTVDAETNSNLILIQWDAQNGGTFHEILVRGWLKLDHSFKYYELPYAGYSQIKKVYRNPDADRYLIYSFVKGCSTCYIFSLSSISFDADELVKDTELSIYARNFDSTIEQVDEDIYTFSTTLDFDGSVHIVSQGKEIYTFEPDYTLDSQTRIVQGQISIDQGIRMSVISSSSELLVE